MAGQLPSYLVVNAVLRDQSGQRVVLVRQTTPTDSEARWALPGGKVEEGESLLAAVRREVIEEAGLSCAADPRRTAQALVGRAPRRSGHGDVTQPAHRGPWRFVAAALAVGFMTGACGAGRVEGASVSEGSPAPTVTQESSSSSRGESGSLAARGLVALAQGDDSWAVPWADRVTYYIGSSLIGDLAAEELPAGLTSCPEATTEYEGRDCPVSPLATIKNAVQDAGVVEESKAPTVVGCTTVKVPSRSADLTATSIRPPRDKRDCFADFAFTLFVDAAGKVVIVQFALSGP